MNAVSTGGRTAPLLRRLAGLVVLLLAAPVVLGQAPTITPNYRDADIRLNAECCRACAAQSDLFLNGGYGMHFALRRHFREQAGRFKFHETIGQHPLNGLKLIDRFPELLSFL